LAIRKLTDLIAKLRKARADEARLLGLDIGAKTIGLALCDPSGTVATPLATIRRTRFTEDARQLRKIIEANGVIGLVIGLPVNMDGSEGRRCQSVRAFADNLLQRMEIDLAFWDERLSTAAVERMMVEGDLSRGRRKQLVDKLAAAYILQGALDRQREAGQEIAHLSGPGKNGPEPI
jgi:putative Holliday junction resolvase